MWYKKRCAHAHTYTPPNTHTHTEAHTALEDGLLTNQWGNTPERCCHHFFQIKWLQWIEMRDIDQKLSSCNLGLVAESLDFTKHGST